jgi:hypothetical protein
LLPERKEMEVYAQFPPVQLQLKKTPDISSLKTLSVAVFMTVSSSL